MAEVDQPGHEKKAEEIKIQSIAGMAVERLRNSPSSVRQQQPEGIQVRAFPSVKLKSLDRGVHIACEQQARIKPEIADMKRHACQIQERSAADCESNGNASFCLRK